MSRRFNDEPINLIHRIPTPEQPDLANRWRYVSAQADELIERGRHVLDRRERLHIYSLLQKQLAQDLPIVPLWHEDNVAVMNRDVVGYQVLPNARFSPLAHTGKRTF